MARTKVVHLNIGVESKLPGRTIPCEVKRSKRKTLALYIKQQTVVVRCPQKASDAEVYEFVKNNENWIKERLREELKLERETLKIEKGSKIFFRARELNIIFKEGRKERVLIDGDKFIVQGHKLNAAKAKVQVEDYLIDKASEYIIPRARGLATYLGVDKRIKEIKLRKTKSKWGHCTSQGILQYNWLIMLAPYSVVDYMITHEVCHMVHMDHSRQYWNLVGSICPDYEHYIEWLKAHEHRFWFD